MLKLIARPLIFLVTLTAALLCVRLLTTRPADTQPPAPPVVTAAPPGVLANQAVQVVFDAVRGRTYTQVTVERDPRAPAPERLYVFTHLYTSTGPEYMLWGGPPLSVRRPFAHGDRVTLTAEGPCDWCAEAVAARGNLYARVLVSTESDPPAERLGDLDIKTATPVVVEHAPKR
ncbi:MAG TPA: hypothetical protein VF546_06595 [Pyrinomonadaceae bacterium]|jgi:hypothetical protein